MTDEHGYPDEADIQKIVNWHSDDWPGMMEYIRGLWQYADAGYWKQSGDLYRISTAGWSGNEEIISAMRRNQNGLFWLICWIWSRRGGHYLFRVKVQP